MAAQKSKKNEFNQRGSKENEQETGNIFGASDWRFDDMDWGFNDIDWGLDDMDWGMD